jgi:hypothetical protein
MHSIFAGTTQLRRRGIALLRFGVILAAMASCLSANRPFTTAGTGTDRTGTGAPNPAIDGFSLGTQFVVDTQFALVAALGIWVAPTTTLTDSHDIGLWDHTAGDTEVAVATVPGGTGRTLGEFGYVAWGTPVLLAMGDTYRLAAYYPSPADQLHDCCSGTPPAADPAFGSFVAVFTASDTIGSLSEPNGGAGDTAYVGPDFQFQVVPEPEEFALAGLGLLTLLLSRAKTGLSTSRT